MKKHVLIRVALTAILINASAQAEPLPSQVDMKAAYCIQLLQNAVAALGTPIPSLSDDVKKLLSADVEKANSNLHHVQLYLVQRIKYLDPSVMTAAMQQGKEDLAHFSKDWDDCATSCSQRDRQEVVACNSKCLGDSAALVRLQTCNDLSFLPF